MLSHSKVELLFQCRGEQEAKRETELEKGDPRESGECIQSILLAVYQLRTNTNMRKSQTHIDRWRCTLTLKRHQDRNGAGLPQNVHAWTDQRSTVQWWALISTLSGQHWMLHATGALLSDSALPVLLCCPTLTKRTVKWLFQSSHSSDVGGQLTSCTSRNRKCVKRRLFPPPWLSCVPAKVLWLHFHRII